MAKPVGKWTGEQIDTAREMLASGMSLKAVGEHFGVSGDTVKCKTDTEYHLRRVRRNNKNRAEKRPHEVPARTAGRFYVQSSARSAPDADCIAARLAEIPRFDTRDFTARMFGDPLPERSALARKHLDRET